MLRSFEVVQNSGLPTHRPLRCTLDLPLSHQTGIRFRKPADIPLDWGLPDAGEETAEASRLIAPIHAASEMHWTACLSEGDVDTAFEILSGDAEAYLGVRAQGTTRVPPHMRGRGHCRVEKHQLMPPQVTEADGAIPCRLHRLQRHLRGVEEILRKVFLDDAIGGSEGLTHTFERSERQGHAP